MLPKHGGLYESGIWNVGRIGKRRLRAGRSIRHNLFGGCAYRLEVSYLAIYHTLHFHPSLSRPAGMGVTYNMITSLLNLITTRLPSRLFFVFPILCLLLLQSFLPEASWAETVFSPAESVQTDKAQLYKNAKDYYFRLERDRKLGNTRQNWLIGVRNFRRIFQREPLGIHAPSCLYMMARMNRRMYQRFQLPIDLDEALNYFQKVTSEFPSDSLADDALFSRAEIYQNEKNDPVSAADLYIDIIENYNGGDKYALAVNNLRELAKTNTITLPDTLTSTNTLSKLVNILPVKYWSSNDYTRIVISASDQVHYASSLLEKDGDKPRRIYIDLAHSHISPAFRAPVPIEDGLLKQVRTGQFDNSTVRVVLDIESISDYKIFSLNDPFRVIIDVRGEKNDTTGSTPVVAQVPEPSKSSPAIGETEVSETYITLKDNKKIKPTAQRTPPEPKQAQISLAQQLGLGIRKIVLDPGHGGKDPGAMGFGLKEKDIVLQVAKKLGRVLTEVYKYDVQFTRDTDVFLPLEERTALANTAGADLFVSVHVNAHPDKSARGVETFYLNLATNAEAMRVAARENATTTHNISDMQNILSDLMQNSKITESSRLAEFVQANMVSGLEQKQYSVKDLGVKQAPFYVLIGAEMPAILAEISFITNPGEAQLLKNEEYLEEIARQIATGVAAYVEHNTSAAVNL